MSRPAHSQTQRWTGGLLALVLFVTAVVCTLTALSNPAVADRAYPFEVISQYDKGKNYIPGARWAKLLDPTQAGWLQEKLDATCAYARGSRTDALLVISHGAVVLACGDVDARLKLHSVRKSLMSVMYGIYNAKGLLNLPATLEALGIDDIGGLTDSEKRATIANLLTSMSGVYHPAAYETERIQEKRPPRGKYAPGEFWYYNNWDFNVLSTIFNKNAGVDFFDAFVTDLAVPLGMEHFRRSDVRYFYERDKSLHPAYLFEMSALDLARVGLLYLRGGDWNGRQLVSKAWVDRSTSPIHVWKSSRPSSGYGYMWFATEEGFYAAGKGGQRLFVLPKRQVVIVHLVDTAGGKRVDNDNIRTLVKMIAEAQQPD